MDEYRSRAGRRLSREVEELLRMEEADRRAEQEFLARRRRRERQRRRMARLRKRRRALLLRMAGVMFLFIVFIILIIRLFFSNPVEKEITVEAGIDDLAAEDFLRKDGVEIEFVTDMSGIDLNHVGEHEITLKAKGKERTSTLIVEDTVAPKGEAQAEAVTVDMNGKVDAADLIASIDDVTDVKCTFKEEPDLSAEASDVPVTVVLTDEGGNTAEVEARINIIEDTEAPVIDGVAPITSFLGDPISYKSEITVTDNCDRDVELEVDNSEVNPDAAGTYTVRYSATDRAGNTAEAETTITIQEKPENYVEPEEVYALADEVLAEITTDDMTLKEKARAIYDWTRNNVGYINTSEKDSWTNGAYQGFTEGQGDCFVFFATSKALLTRAEIPNIDVVKSDTSHSSHYWSLIDCGDGWYHFDTTPRYGGGAFFMLTDAEILEYSQAHNNSHIFDQSLYPATPETDSTIE
ncbi:MAG TPA: DUF5011 domain-containing protein [Candidatus Mediterraneibacter colneyensis]|nr:DUF5011 domain-containing protein [Candidatus Mediterraneibacter colneyensis]